MGRNTEEGYENAVTVRIWMPNGKTEGAMGPLANFLGAGHASLTVKLNRERYYITWQVAHGMPNGKEQPARDYTTHPMLKNIDEGYMNGMGWGAMNGASRGISSAGHSRSECTHKIRLKTLQPNETRPATTGLDAQAIIDWWNQRCQTEKTYCLISKTHNCTGCVTEALQAGGLGNKPGAVFVVTAADVLSWVLQEGKKQNLIWH